MGVNPTIQHGRQYEIRKVFIKREGQFYFYRSWDNPRHIFAYRYTTSGSSAILVHNWWEVHGLDREIADFLQLKGA
jgi:hypothetical protein